MNSVDFVTGPFCQTADFLKDEPWRVFRIMAELVDSIEEMSKLKMASVSSSEIETMKEFDSEFYSLDLYIRKETSDNEALQQRIAEFNKKDVVVKAYKIFSK